MDLEDPVEDEKGYVYSRAAIIQHINSTRQGWCEAPISGASHRVTVASLKPSARVKRQQKRRRLGLGGQQRGTQGGGGAGGSNADIEVIDV